MTVALDTSYSFKPHEMPMMPGSPASPTLSRAYRLAYIVIGILLAFNAGLQNGVLIASLPQLRGELGLSLEQGGWIQVSYYMTYACMSILFFKVRQHFGVRVFLQISLLLMIASNLLQILFNSYQMELLSRGFSGVACSGLMVMAMFYLMQGLPEKAKLLSVILGGGIIQLGTPLAQIITPFLLADGQMENVFLFQGFLTFLCVVCVLRLPLPPTLIIPSLTKIDLLSFICFASGIALLCGFLVQGRIVWWTTEWIGILLATSIALIGIGLWIESQRHKPMLDWQWISSRHILIFAFLGAVVRLLTSEQTVGAAGLMATLGMSNSQMVDFYWVVLGASLLGLLMSIVTLKLTDLRRSVSLALLGIAVGAFMDTQIGVETRPEQLYVSQALIAFSTLLFFGPMMLEGLVRALSVSPNHIMSFSAVFGLSQTLGGLAGAAVFSAFLNYRTQTHFSDMVQHFSLTDPQFALGFQQLSSQFLPIASDSATAQALAVQHFMNQAIKEATVYAYNDLFMLIGIMASIAFVYTLLTWLYRQITGKILLGKEISMLMNQMK